MTAVSSGSTGSETPNPTNVGGQAVIEGVMMRAPGALSIVCRKRDGSLVLRERTIATPTSPLVKLPLVRGIYTLVSSLKIGHQALRFSAEILEEGLEEEDAKAAEQGEVAAAKKAVPPSIDPPGIAMMALLTSAQFLASAPDDAEPVEDKKPEPKKEPEPVMTKRNAPSEPKKEQGVLGAIATALPILFAIGLFIVLPQAVAEGASRLFNLGYADDIRSPGFQAITGAAKLTIIVTYLSLIRLIPDVRRVFQYHGAEHKSISTYEAGKDLVVAQARPTSALHARCGTTFIIMVAFVSVVIFSIGGAFLPQVQGPKIVQHIALFFMKLPLLPVIGGITFELQRFFAKYCTTGPLRVLLWPGFLVQKITTAPPDDDQLEVALASLRSALANAPVTLPQDHPDRSFSSYALFVSKVVPHPITQPQAIAAAQT